MKYKFAKDDTWAVKGVAIIFLVCLQCVSRTRIQGLDVTFWPLKDKAASWYMGLTAQCVGMFEFLSVYGMTLSFKKKYPDFSFTGKEAFADIVRRYIGLVFKFFIPFWVCFAVTYGMGVHRYQNGFWKNILSMILDILCLGNIFGTQMMVPTWWFLSLEVLLIVILPLVLVFYKKYSWLMVGMIAIIGTMHSGELTDGLMTKFLFVIPLAVCLADRHIFERLKAIVIIKNTVLNKIFKTCLAFGIIYCMCSLRGFKEAHFEFILLGFIPTALIYFFYEFIIDVPVLRKVLIVLGKHSANIFYIHSFVRGIWLKDVTYSFHSAWMIVGFVLGVTLLISVAIEILSSVTGYNIVIAKYVDKIINRC